MSSNQSEENFVYELRHHLHNSCIEELFKEIELEEHFFFVKEINTELYSIIH